MGVFRDLGRRAERFKREIEAAAEASGECADCGASRSPDVDECPACGSEELAAPE